MWSITVIEGFAIAYIGLFGCLLADRFPQWWAKGIVAVFLMITVYFGIVNAHYEWAVKQKFCVEHPKHCHLVP